MRCERVHVSAPEKLVEQMRARRRRKKPCRAAGWSNATGGGRSSVTQYWRLGAANDHDPVFDRVDALHAERDQRGLVAIRSIVRGPVQRDGVACSGDVDRKRTQ